MKESLSNSNSFNKESDLSISKACFGADGIYEIKIANQYSRDGSEIEELVNLAEVPENLYSVHESNQVGWSYKHTHIYTERTRDDQF